MGMGLKWCVLVVLVVEEKEEVWEKMLGVKSVDGVGLVGEGEGVIL